MTTESLAPIRTTHRAVDALLPFVDALAAAVGPICELVLHDFGDPAHSVIRIAGNLTHRSPGAPMTNILVDVLQRTGDATPDLFNYRSEAPDGRVMRSSTIFIRHEGRIVGALCVNVDISGLIAADDLLRLVINGTERPLGLQVAPNTELPVERFGNTVAEMLDDLVRQAVDGRNVSPLRLSRGERLGLIADLEDRGAFLIKGGVEIVGQRLGISKFTIYSDLQRIRANRSLGVDSLKVLRLAGTR